MDGLALFRCWQIPSLLSQIRQYFLSSINCTVQYVTETPSYVTVTPSYVTETLIYVTGIPDLKNKT